MIGDLSEIEWSSDNEEGFEDPERAAGGKQAPPDELSARRKIELYWEQKKLEKMLEDF